MRLDACGGKIKSVWLWQACPGYESIPGGALLAAVRANADDRIHRNPKRYRQVGPPKQVVVSAGWH